MAGAGVKLKHSTFGSLIEYLSHYQAIPPTSGRKEPPSSQKSTLKVKYFCNNAKRMHRFTQVESQRPNSADGIAAIHPQPHPWAQFVWQVDNIFQAFSIRKLPKILAWNLCFVAQPPLRGDVASPLSSPQSMAGFNYGLIQPNSLSMWQVYIWNLGF